METNELNNDEMYAVNGGGISSAIVNAIAGIIEIIVEIGEKTGSSIRRLIEGEYCDLN